MRTTVIGSYPSAPTSQQLAAAYISPDFDPYLGPIQTAVQAQLDAGIQMVSDGQVRDNMIDMFVKGLEGTRLHGSPIIIGEIGFKGTILKRDLQFVRSMLPDDRQLKGIITGPYTLAKSCTDNHYKDMKGRAMAFARALNQEARAIQDTVDLIQVDEPFFSEDYPEYAIELLGTVLDDVEVPTALHVCGDVSSIFQHLAELKVDILEHEFAANPDLLDVVMDVDFPQDLGLGSVRSDSEEIEQVQAIKSHIQRALEHFPPEKLVISPDCGLRFLPEKVARAKLENMVQAVKEVQ